VTATFPVVTSGGTVSGIQDVPGLQAALAALQSAATAATDTELSDAVSTLQSAIGLKQDASTAATDAELAAAVSTINAAMATDTELASAIAPLATQAALDAKSVSDRAYADSVGGNVELAYAQITTIPPAADAITDVAGLSITVTVGARPILLAVGGQFSVSSSSGLGQLSIYEGITSLAEASLGPASPVNFNVPLYREIRLSPSAGSHTYKVRIACVLAGKATLGASATAPAYIRAVQL
jgi:hypothetical protein